VDEPPVGADASLAARGRRARVVVLILAVLTAGCNIDSAIGLAAWHRRWARISRWESSPASCRFSRRGGRAGARGAGARPPARPRSRANAQPTGRVTARGTHRAAPAAFSLQHLQGISTLITRDPPGGGRHVDQPERSAARSAAPR
jgi:hypothetical protein